MADTFRDNVVILTGASAGIGREMALQLADQGAWLALAARTEERLQDVAEQCRRRGGRALAAATDVAVETQCQALVEQTVGEYGRIDTLINNAGISMWARFDDVEELDFFRTIMDVNYFGSLYCTFYALPYLKQRNGRIVGVSSLTGKTGVPTRSGYAASKHAMAGFFDSLRIELMDSGVTVTMLYPDFVATDVRKRAFGADGQPMGDSPVHEDKIMTAETCARLCIEAIAARKRERLLSFRGKIGQWARLVVPGVVDRVARNAISRGR